MKKRIRIGDLVKLHTQNTGLIGIVLDREPKAISTTPAQIGIKWFTLTQSGINWEPESWLEVVSEGR